MGREDIKQIQSILLDMFKWFQSVCQEHNLRYYVIGGTMLGAVRHKGVIPWDDDIDVGMPREDYNRFIALGSHLRESRYVIEAPREDNKDYQYLYAKVYDTTTTLVENVRYPAKRGLYIDVFPLDGVGNTKERAEKNGKRIINLINLEMMIICAIRKERKWYKNIGVLVGHMISPLFISERWLNNKIATLCEAHSFDEAQYVGNLVGNWGLKEIMPRAYFGQPKKYSFEGMEVYGPEDADAYLTALYGDYMKLPPEEKRVSHHDYLLMDLNLPYIN